VSFERYNIFKNHVTRMLKREKSKYFERKFESTYGDAAGTWRTINSLVGRKNTKSIPSELIYDNTVYSSTKDIASCFNSYFTAVAMNLDRDIPQNDVSPTEYMGDRVQSSLFVGPATEQDVKTVICSLKNGSGGLHTVPIFIYKTCASVLSSIMAKLFNLSVSLGTFPSCLKVARVIPIFKAGNTSSPGNYRPISTLPIMSKIFEKLMYRQLIVFLKSMNILSPCQFGFRKNCSTSDAVLEFVDCANNILDQKMSMLTVFLDFSKAFDTVKHEILIDKLEHLGIRGLAKEWFRSYVCGRRQYVDVSGDRSELLNIQNGVPQGSVLGPVLFLLYINDMSRCSFKLKFIHFADDTTAFGYGDNIHALADEMNEELNRIYLWLCSNRLSLNIEKTSFMVLSDKKQLDVIPNIRINDVNVHIVREAKFLGVLIDCGLTFRAHVDSVCKKISKNIGMLNRISWLVPPVAKKSIYFSLIYPYVVYGVVVWGGRSVGNYNHVNRLLKRATKMVSHPYPIYYGPTRGFLNFESIYKYFTLVKIFRVIKLDQHLYFKNLVNELLPIHEHATRFNSCGYLKPPYYSKAKCQKSFFYVSVKLWNELSDEIKSCDQLRKFRKLVRGELIRFQTTF